MVLDCPDDVASTLFVVSRSCWYCLVNSVLVVPDESEDSGSPGVTSIWPWLMVDCIGIVKSAVDLP